PALLMGMGRGPECSRLPQDPRGSSCLIATGEGSQAALRPLALRRLRQPGMGDVPKILTEIAKRLNVICAQLIPFLSQEHQQQVVQAVERAKQVTMTDLNAAIGVPLLSPPAPPQHQLQTQHLSHHAPPIPLTPHPSGMQPTGLAGISSASGLLALSGALGAQAQLLAKDDRGVHDSEPR
ncbi:PREDICTED: transducin-like enhancer protein 1, partial [Leptosomus discolor]|uniref:transducin-like enhancer protein 1 n=1 Tax=Leptosomus discolor TaxID=188344 RepID=UPI0005223EE2